MMREIDDRLCIGGSLRDGNSIHRWKCTRLEVGVLKKQSYKGQIADWVQQENGRSKWISGSKKKLVCRVDYGEADC